MVQLRLLLVVDIQLLNQKRDAKIHRRFLFNARRGHNHMTRRDRDHIERARAELADFFARVKAPYIAYSGGKDSQVAAHLAHSVRPDIPMVYSDDEFVLADYAAHMESERRRYGDLLIYAQGATLHAYWHVPWTDEPFWRPRPPDMTPMPVQRVDWSRRLRQLYGFDGIILGVRSSESLIRAEYLGEYARKGNRRRRQGLAECDPIAGWSDEQVWDYIREHEIPYCVVYDRQAETGVALRKRRLGPMAWTMFIDPKFVWTAYPDEYARAVARYGMRWRRPRRGQVSGALLVEIEDAARRYERWAASGFTNTDDMPTTSQ